MKQDLNVSKKFRTEIRHRLKIARPNVDKSLFTSLNLRSCETAISANKRISDFYFTLTFVFYVKFTLAKSLGGLGFYLLFSFKKLKCTNQNIQFCKKQYKKISTAQVRQTYKFSLGHD